MFAAGMNDAFAQMSDAQVVEYTKTAVAAGKSQAQIAQELLAKGVTQEQAERIRAQYEAEQETGGTSSTTQQAVRGELDTRESRAESGYTRDAATPEDVAIAAEASGIFGHDIFRGGGVSFEPNNNSATPEDYTLGPGDQIVIDIWGQSEASISATITPEGLIRLTQVGPVQLSGLTIAEATKKLERALSQVYAGFYDNSSSLSVSLANIRTIQVNIMGEVRSPGTYRLSSFATVFHALYRSGGVNDNASLRAIKVVRGGKTLPTVDVYGYLFDGRSDTDIRLQEGDIIIVPPYEKLVKIEGAVKRPMTYELIDGETLQTLIGYAGGFASHAYSADLRVLRQTAAEREIFTVKDSEFASYEMADGDDVFVSENLDRFANRVEIRGYVFRPGMFELGSEIATVRQLVERAGGPTEDAFLGRAVLLREKDDLSIENISVDLGGVLSGSSSDVLLKKNDVIVVSSIHEIEDRGELYINGMVAAPGTFPFADHTTVEDLILMAGGLLDGASTARVDIARRMIDPASDEYSETLGEVFTFPLKDGLLIDGGEEFYLEPYDIVTVRRSPGYRRQELVTVSGEILFSGQYALVQDGERLSSVLKRAGGVTPKAYVPGAMLIRRPLTEAEDGGQAAVAKSAAISRYVNSINQAGGDTLDVAISNLSQAYTVAIELDKALSQPGSDADIVLKEGDIIYVPPYVGTVRVMGNVMYPNALVYEKGKSLTHYIKDAGGYGFRAKRSKVFVVYMDGSAASGRNAAIEPGCNIIVPSKAERKQMSIGEISTLTSVAASLTSLVAIMLR